jgi:hypothetical protein
MAYLSDPNKQYVPAAKTNILLTLMRHGFEPPSTDPRYQKKWAVYRQLATRDLEGINVNN